MTNKKMPEWFEPAMAATWRFVRVFLAGAIASVSIDALVAADKDLRLQILQAAITGGIAAVFKYIRDKSESRTINKLPL